MKKILTGIVSTGLALTLGILGVSAASGSVLAACTWAAMLCSVRTIAIPPSPSG